MANCLHVKQRVDRKGDKLANGGEWQQQQPQQRARHLRDGLGNVGVEPQRPRHQHGGGGDAPSWSTDCNDDLDLSRAACRDAAFFAAASSSATSSAIRLSAAAAYSAAVSRSSS